jgi:2-polyprenyl-6-methoxyphenol hydroxylase-like FAD-dependent oxidoreductase
LRKEGNNKAFFTSCDACRGTGKKSRKTRKKNRLQYLAELERFEQSNGTSKSPIRPKRPLLPCVVCSGSGLVPTENQPIPNEAFPHLAIIGGGIGGVALAVACWHRHIPFTLYERDINFEARSQGYGLTLQQATKAIEALGLFSLKEGVVSTRHVVHTTEGDIIGEWGMRKWLKTEDKAQPRRTNVHIARQSLRSELLQLLGDNADVQWGHQFVDYNKTVEGGVEIQFQVNGALISTKADLVVGADGIRSSVRQKLIGDGVTPLRYLDCIVILGICPLSALVGIESDLLDSATVFQTANGNERIYMMPYDAHSIMWQLSFPMAENEAKNLSDLGSEALKAEACKRTQWHDPIPQIMAATEASKISGYPVYDRQLLTEEAFQNIDCATLIGDAAHPMSPFKGQGANQALLDALLLARGIAKDCGPYSNWKEVGIRQCVLTQFESEMLERSAVKVKDSAEAAKFLHSDVVLRKADAPRGRGIKKTNENQ